MKSGNHIMKSGNHIMKSGNHIMKSENPIMKSGNHIMKSGNHIMKSGNHIMKSLSQGKRFTCIGAATGFLWQQPPLLAFIGNLSNPILTRLMAF